MVRFPARCLVLLALPLMLLAASACDRGNDSAPAGPHGGATRPYLMGYSSLPRELNADAYADAIDFAGDHGDVVLIQRMLPWSEFVPGGGVSDETASNSASEIRAVRDNKLKLFFAIDVTDGATGRDRLAGLPVALQGKRFDDPDVRAAFVSYAEYVALNYKPDYLALGVEMNLYYEKNKQDFDNFRSLYAEAYDAVKKQSPNTQVTVTLQYEDLQGLLPREDPHFPSWQLTRAFNPKLDVMAISSYPSFRYPSAAAIPANYYTQLRAFTDKPIVIAEMGFSSQPGQQGLNSGSEEQQAAFVKRALADAQKMPVALVVWFAIWDPGWARDTAFAAFQSIGLWTNDEREKPAWSPWAEAAARPFEAPQN